MKLNAIHLNKILLLASGMNNKQVAEEQAPETISRWKSDFNLGAELNKQLSQNHEQSQSKLRALTETALNTIESVMVDDTAPNRDRITAAFKLLEITRLKQSNVTSSITETRRARSSIR